MRKIEAIKHVLRVVMIQQYSLNAGLKIFVKDVETAVTEDYLNYTT